MKSIVKSAILTGVFVFWIEKKTRIKKGIKQAANKEKEKTPSEAAISRACVCSKWLTSKIEALKIRLTNWERKRKIKTLKGIIRKRILEKIAKKIWENFSLFFSIKIWENKGKLAVAKETPISPTGIYCKLLEKLKTLIAPAERVEAIAVIITKFKL